MYNLFKIRSFCFNQNDGEGSSCLTTPDWDKHSSSSEVSVACLQDKIIQVRLNPKKIQNREHSLVKWQNEHQPAEQTKSKQRQKKRKRQQMLK